jgi:hypothetical protein
MVENGSYYRLPEETLPSLSFKDHAVDMLEMVNFIEKLGIVTHNTRFSRYAKYFQELAEGKPINEKKIFKNINDVRFASTLDWQMYLLREVHELMWILRGLKKHMPKGVESKLEKIVSGSDFAALDKNTESRDTQFELRMASYFCQFGCAVDLSTDTDIIAISDNNAYFVECKRIAGIRNLKDNLVKAKNQIVQRMSKRHEGKNASGIIAADVTKLAFAHNGITWGKTPTHARDIIQSKLIEIGRKAYALPIFTGRPDVIECLLQIHIPSIVMHPPIPTTRFSSYSLHSRGVDRKSRSAIREFFVISHAGKIPDEREIPSKKLKFRKHIDVPEGTKYFLKQELITKILLSETEQDYAPDVVIAGIDMDGEDQEFTAQDLIALRNTLESDVICKFAENESSARIELLLEMYVQRFPYENSTE